VVELLDELVELEVLVDELVDAALDESDVLELLDPSALAGVFSAPPELPLRSDRLSVR
jgi:hypothetical protein